MSDIVLSSAIRSNLLALQNSAQTQETVQNRLATGRKVNSPLDNATSFFTASAFSTRAGQLSTLLDSIGNGVQTLKAASTGIEAISKLVDNLRATARQALQAPSAYAVKASAVSSTALPNGWSNADLRGTPTIAAVITATTAAVNQTTTGKITLNGTDVAVTTADTPATVVSAINAKTSTTGVTASLSSGKLVLAQGNTTVNLQVAGDAQVLTDLGVAAGTTPPTSSLDGKTLTFAVGAGPALTYTFDTAHKSVDDLNNALSTIGLSASVDANGKVSVTTTSQTESQGFVIGGTGATVVFGSAAPAVTPASRSGSGATSRDGLVSQFNGLLAQIDTIARDATFNGISLLKGDTLSVVFNESNSSKLDVRGVSFDSAGLGLTKLQASDFADGNSIAAVIAKLDQSSASLQTQASKFGSNNTVVQTRQEFTKAMMNTLTVGADNLVNADTNEEGANLLALQTRQQLSQSALSLAAQAQQAVLRLFG